LATDIVPALTPSIRHFTTGYIEHLTGAAGLAQPKEVVRLKCKIKCQLLGVIMRCVFMWWPGLS
jgi:hypothetical protein